MKSYTDLEQSKKLAEILLLESADMEFMFLKKDNSMVGRVPFVKDGYEEPDCGYNIVPCWSLAALLNVLPNRVTIDGYCWFLSLGKKRISYLGYMTYDGQLHISVESDNLIDACYEMIIKLKELNLL